jgi:hypothetical protein
MRRAQVLTGDLAPLRDGDRADQASALAGLSANNSPLRTYRVSVASEACPVWDAILRVDTPACIALVAKPARRAWAENPVGSIPAPATRSLTMSNTASPDNRAEATRPCRSTGRKTGPWSMLETLARLRRERVQWEIVVRFRQTSREATSAWRISGTALSIAWTSTTLTETPPSCRAWTKNFHCVASCASPSGSSISLKSTASSRVTVAAKPQGKSRGRGS